jgi:hypothetical protein
MNMEYEATPLGRPSPEGLEAVELFPWRPSEFPGKKPALGERVSVTVVTSSGTFQGGIRTYPSDDKESVYLCPDLYRSNGAKVSLAKVLDEVGIKPKDTVKVRVEGNKWIINL